jgi:uncharacterized protein YidB (DUF937 family)
MFSETLLIKPKLDSRDLNSMEASLTTRFGKIAKKFGKGLGAALTGGGVAGLALGLVDKLLNPLKETQEAIDRVLAQGDDIVTNAKQFGTTAGKLFRLQQLAKSTGLDEGSLAVLLQKFQASVAEAEADPNKQTSVRNFVGQSDMAEAFFEFIQSLQKMDKNQQVLVQQEVFGEKQILKMADFLQTDFGWQQQLIGGPSSGELNKPLEHLGDLNDLKDVLAANRAMVDAVNKSKSINAGMVKLQDEMLRQDLARENRQVQSYKDLAAISIASAEILNFIRDIGLKVTSMAVQLTNLLENVKAITNSRFIRGLLKMGGGK